VCSCYVSSFAGPREARVDGRFAENDLYEQIPTAGAVIKTFPAASASVQIKNAAGSVIDIKASRVISVKTECDPSLEGGWFLYTN
jgi:hypothetical protein